MVKYTTSKLFQPRINIPIGKEKGLELISKSQKLLNDLGLIRTESQGTNIVLPFAMRALTKLTNLIKKELDLIGAQEISLPSLTPHRLLEKTNRSAMPELFTLKDRHGKQLVLGPTHEEAVTNFVSNLKLSYRQLPLLLYQISNKYRDEMKPRFGLMRAREFLMKDMYCFETSSENSLKNYNTVNDCYHKIFKKLGVPYSYVTGSTGEIGGKLSHEFHVLSDVGEDKLTICQDCGNGQNQDTGEIAHACEKCGSAGCKIVCGIEVGHSFLLGTTYSKPLNAMYNTSNNSTKLLEMSCHGIGVSRFLAACIEALSTTDKIQWPTEIVPFSACLLPPKAGSREEKTTISTDTIYKELCELFPNDVILDDRTDLTIGKRVMEATRIGYPYLVIIGKSSTNQEPSVEIINTKNGSIQLVSLKDLSNVLIK